MKKKKKGQAHTPFQNAAAFWDGVCACQFFFSFCYLFLVLGFSLWSLVYRLPKFFFFFALIDMYVTWLSLPRASRWLPRKKNTWLVNVILYLDVCTALWPTQYTPLQKSQARGRSLRIRLDSYIQYFEFVRSKLLDQLKTPPNFF